MARLRFIFLIISCLALSVQASYFNYYYIVKKNDFASQLLDRAHFKSIYGKNGTLELLQKFNEERVPDINKLTPGQKLFFPQSLALKAKNRGAVHLTEQLEIVFIDEVRPRVLANEDELAPVAQPETSAIKVTQKNYPRQAPLAQSEFKLALETGYSRIDSRQNSGDATLLSKPTSGFKLGWSQFWTDDWQSFINWSWNSVSFSDTSIGVVVGGERQITSCFSVGLQHQLPLELNAGLEVGTREEIFAPSYLNGVATLETRPISFFRFTLLKDLVELRRLRLSGFLGGTYLLGLSNAKYDVKSGYDYFGGLRVTHRLNSISIFASGEYGATFQDTSLASQSRKDIRMQLGVNIPMDADESTKENSP